MRYFHRLVFLVVLSLSSPLLAQKEYNQWYFGSGGHLDFSTDPPTFDESGMTRSLEGTASISDPVTGQLLFYTDGLNVWNRQHAQMPNGYGLFSDHSSTQAALIVNDPSDHSLYYIFTVDQSGYLGLSRGLNYSIVDMKLDGGLGDVTSKNVNLLPQAAEKLTAVRLCGGSAYWIIGHGLYDNIFYAWHLDHNGLNPIAVESEIGSFQGSDPNCGIGWLSASPNGRMLASTIHASNIPDMGNSLEMFNFDPATGIVSNVISTDLPYLPYGVSFSPDNRRLYVSTGSAIEQYTVTTWTASDVLGSVVKLLSGGLWVGALKLGPNGKIYVQNVPYIGVIANPNALGAACNYTPKVFEQLDGDGAVGLPNNIDARVEDVCGGPKAIIGQLPEEICKTTCINFRDSSLYNPDTWRWTFQGGSPATHNGRVPPKVCYGSTGTYSVKLVVSNRHGKDSVTKQIRIIECPKPELALQDTTICLNDCISFNDTTSAPGERTWTFENGTPSSHNGKTSSPICYTKPGKHKVTLIASNALNADTAIAYVTVADCSAADARFEHDTLICSGDSLLITNTSTGTTDFYYWTFEGGTPSSSSLQHPLPVKFESSGRFRISLLRWTDHDADSAYSWVTVRDCSKPKAILHDYVLCAGECIDLRDSSLNTPTAWSWITEGGDRTAFNVQHPGRVCYNTPGTFTLRLIASNEFGMDTIIRTVTVERREGWASEDIILTEPIPVCDTFDTTITLYAGCAESSFSSFLSLNEDIHPAQTFGTIPANDSLTVGLRIQSTTPGTHDAELRVVIDGKETSIHVFYTIGEADESIVISRFDSVFTAAPCQPIDHELVIQNSSCTSLQVVSVQLDPFGSASFRFSGVQMPLDIPPGDSAKIIVTFDPVYGHHINTLIIRTANGSERRVLLRGFSPYVTMSRLSLKNAGSSSFIAGDIARYSLAFDDAVDIDHAPEQIDLELGYNTDLLTLLGPQSEAGWVLESYNEANNMLRATLKRAPQAIAEGEKLLTLSFKTSLAKEDSTQLALSDITTNAYDLDFEKCILLIVPGDSGSVTVGANCGEDELQHVMGKERPLVMSIRPNPVAEREGMIYLDLVKHSAIESIPYSIDLTDIMGRSVPLSSGALTTSYESLQLQLPASIQGLYVLRLVSHFGTLSEPLLIR